MSTEFGSSNPYVSPNISSYTAPVPRDQAPNSVLAAGMGLMAVATLGLIVSIFNFAMSFGVAHVDPGAPEFVRQVQQGAVGPVATALQGGFCMLNLFIIICGYQMITLKSWGLSVTGSVLAMLNIGSCCCVAGLPVGIFSLMVLMSPDVISTFSSSQYQ